MIVPSESSISLSVPMQAGSRVTSLICHWQCTSWGTRSPSPATLARGSGSLVPCLFRMSRFHSRAGRFHSGNPSESSVITGARTRSTSFTRIIAARRSLNLSPDDRVAIYVGRLDYPKNEEWMLDLAVAARDRLPNLKLLLVGEGPHERDLRERIMLEDLEGRVVLLGHRDPLPVYQAA